MQAVASFTVRHILAPVVVFFIEKIMGWRVIEESEYAEFIQEPKFIFLTEYHTANMECAGDVPVGC